MTLQKKQSVERLIGMRTAAHRRGKSLEATGVSSQFRKGRHPWVWCGKSQRSTTAPSIRAMGDIHTRCSSMRPEALPSSPMPLLVSMESARGVLANASASMPESILPLIRQLASLWRESPQVRMSKGMDCGYQFKGARDRGCLLG